MNILLGILVGILVAFLGLYSEARSERSVFGHLGTHLAAWALGVAQMVIVFTVFIGVQL